MKPGATLHLLDLTRAMPDPGPLAALLNGDERRRADTLSGLTRWQWMAGRVWLRALLARRLGVSAAALEFECGADGKPFLPRHPELSFNLSHAHTMLACVLGTDGQYGVDVEYLGRALPAAAHWRRVLNRAEQRYVGASAARFLRVWVCKEAVLKADGAGVRLGLRSVALAHELRRSLRLARVGYAVGDADGGGESGSAGPGSVGTGDGNSAGWSLRHARAGRFVWAVARKATQATPATPFALAVDSVVARPSTRKAPCAPFPY